MDNQILKRRITGAVVLVGLAVIFIPMILSGGRDEMPLFGSNIPDRPKSIRELKSIEIPAPAKLEQPSEIRVPVETHLPAPDKKTAQLKDEKKTASGKTKKPVNEQAKKKSASPKAWAVQVGSFSNRNNALSLQKKLRKKKFAAFVEYVKNSKGSVYRVRIGPEVKRDKAEAILKSVQEKLEIKGVVVSHP